MTTTPRLGAPQVADASATPGTDCNEQCVYFDQGANLWSIVDRDLTSPPGTPRTDAAYIVAASPSGAWAGQAGKIAFYSNSAWVFLTIKEGMGFWIEDEDAFLIATSSSTFQSFTAGLRLIAFFFTTAPTASEVLCIYVAADAFTIPANLVGAQVKLGANPAATFAIDVQKNGTTIGTISISTSGVATLTTTSGTSKSIAAGDVIKFVAPSSADASIANVAITVKGTL